MVKTIQHVTCAILILSSALAAESTKSMQLQPKALDFTGTYALRQIDPSLTGNGISLITVCRSATYEYNNPRNDFKFNTSHNCLSSANVNFFDSGQMSSGATSQHATAIASIIIGDDPYAYHKSVGKFYYQGAAPQTNIFSYEYSYFISEFLYAKNQLSNADILTMSIGTGQEEWWTRGVDQVAEQRDLVVIAGIGNGGKVFSHVLYPAAGYNVIGVGVVDSVKSEVVSKQLANFWLPQSEHSSHGPTQDGRAKPDLVAPGNCLVATSDDNQRYITTGDYSSYAAPVVAGTASLLIQKAKETEGLELAIPKINNNGSTVIKSILMTSATKGAWWQKGSSRLDDDIKYPLDFSQGAGILNAKEAYQVLVNGRFEPGKVPFVGWDNNKFDTKNSKSMVYEFELPDDTGASTVTATLNWKVHYTEKYPFNTIENGMANFKLELYATTPFYPNEFEKIDISDSIKDNLEHIHFANNGLYRKFRLVITMNENSPLQTEDYALSWQVRPVNQGKNFYHFDLNGDGVVNSKDYTILTMNLNSESEESVIGDINEDGELDMRDLQLLGAFNGKFAKWYKNDED